MKVLLTGATGFVGKQLGKTLALEGHELIVVTRNKAEAKYSIPAPHIAIEWKDVRDPARMLDKSLLKNLDAVIHLAGESIVSKRWTPAFKKKIRDSRIEGTKSLITFLENLGGPKPRIFITASASGYYGDCGNDPIDETHPPGSDFLAKICKEWESTLFDSSLSDTRKVALRIGVVLGKGGGALEKMIPAFTSGLGASLGSGKEWMSWIHIDDLV
ncbi:MAG: TIGR01777 family oxidoreductase, partial [Bdellovibrionia bacterium]